MLISFQILQIKAFCQFFGKSAIQLAWGKLTLSVHLFTGRVPTSA